MIKVILLEIKRKLFYKNLPIKSNAQAGSFIDIGMISIKYRYGK